MTVLKLLKVVRIVVLGIAFLLLLLGHAIPGWYNIETIENDIALGPRPYISRRVGLWYADVCIGNDTNCSLYSLPLLWKSFGVDWAGDFVKAWIPHQVIAVLVLVLCTSVMIRTFWELRNTPSLSKHDLIAFFAILLAGVIGATMVLDMTITQIVNAIKRDFYIPHFPFALFAFALGSYLTLAVAVTYAIDIMLRLRSSFYEDTARQPQGEHSPQSDIPRSLRYFLTVSKVVLPIALVLLVSGIVTPRWRYQNIGTKMFQMGIWYMLAIDYRCKLNLERDFINAKVFTLIAIVLTLLSVIVVVVTNARKQRYTLTTCLLALFSLTLASASFSTWSAGFSIKYHVMSNAIAFPYSLFLFSFGAGMNVLMAIYQAVILIRIWPSVTTHMDEATVPILDNNAFELPDIHEDIPEMDESMLNIY